MPELARHRQAARDVFVDAHGRAEVELVDRLRLELVRTIRRQRPVGRVAVAGEHHRRVVVAAADVRAGAAVLVRLRQARVVAIQAAPQVAARSDQLFANRLSSAELDAVVLPLRLRHRRRSGW